MSGNFGERVELTAPFHVWLKARRAVLGLTQRDLARRLNYSPETIRKIEAGALKPSKQIADLLADPLEIPSRQRDDYLMFAAGPAKTKGRTRNLPDPLTPLLGRDTDVSALLALLKNAHTRLLTLVGPPGVGKTRLAIEVTRLAASSYLDGVCYVELAAMTSPDEVLARLAKTLEVDDRPNESLVTAIQDHVHDKHLLLTLDNFEQILVAVPEIAQLLAHAPRLKILVTSREPLHVLGEQRYHVPALPVVSTDGIPAAIELFLQRARETRPNFAPDTEALNVIRTICERLDGLPLAIELAAARVALFSPKELLDGLDKRFTILSSPSRDLPERQRTLRKTLDWSYELLTPEEQALYRRLSVFSGGCPLAAIQAFCNVDRLSQDAVSTVSALVDKNLLVRRQFSSGESCFGLLETIRAHALEKLTELGESEVWHSHLAEYVAAEGESGAGWLLESQDTWRAAMRWAQSSPVVNELETRLIWITPLSPMEIIGWLDRTLTRLDETPVNSLARARTLAIARGTYHVLGEHRKAKLFGDQAIALYRTLNRPAELAQLLHVAGNNARDQGELEAANAYLDEAYTLFRQLDALSEAAHVLMTQAEVAVAGEEVGRADQLLAEASALHVVRPYTNDSLRQHFVAWLSNHMGHVALLRGDSAGARRCFNHSLEQYAQSRYEIHSRWCAAWNYHSLAELALSESSVSGVQFHIGECLLALDTVGDKMVAAWCLATLAGSFVLDEEPERGAVLWYAAESLRERLGARIASASKVNRERTLRLLEQQLDAVRLRELGAQGDRMSLREAIEFARAGLGLGGEANKMQRQLS